MENASKALIIAGAILLAILIISLGIFIFSQAQNSISSVNMNEQEIMAFNEKFQRYEGTNKRGADVNSLLNAIIQNNVANQEDASKQVKVTLSVKTENWQKGDNKPAGVIMNTTTKALTGKTYTVTCSLDDKTGLVTDVTIEDIK